MEQVAIWRRMAEKWREAADEVAEPTLRRCYVQRAATYERLAAREDQPGRRSTTELRDS
ncbi:MAG TPA: hypothetical protein VN823_07375 [Stellaceae bacterium]|nr:hypothetical protein [Stellaceae bacterium]